MIWKLANPQLRDLAVYEPGKPIEETARALDVHPDAIIKLASNENPLGPSPKAIEAMHAGLENAHLYPDGGSFYLREALATRLGFAPENIILGNGSNEVIEFLGHAFLHRGDDVITSSPRWRKACPRNSINSFDPLPRMMFSGAKPSLVASALRK